MVDSGASVSVMKSSTARPISEPGNEWVIPNSIITKLEECYYVSMLNPSRKSITVQAGKEIAGLQSMESTTWPVMTEETNIVLKWGRWNLLTKYSHLVHENNPSTLKTTTITKHHIKTESHQPIRSAPYRVSPTERKAIRAQVDEILQAGIIAPSSSPWSSPVVMVKKK
ncbi:Uncharacterized protein APZ42_028889 [Daphnia magna]|uniref:Uncharacterized protein n=1 Tax=Daphnia magna TaxID=35525 RepID=A0A164Q2A2_9CRUS|nr:Uncharacterized protein APZ42_028889 [Daphnia magna]